MIPVLLVIPLVLVWLAVASRRPTAPLESRAAWISVVAMAGLGALLVAISASSDFWYVVVAESEITDQYMVRSGRGPIPVAILGALVAAVVVAGSAFAHRSYAGLTVAIAWLLTGAVWFAYVVDDGSSRSSAELHEGPRLLAWAMVALTGAAVTRWLGWQYQRHPATRSHSGASAF